MSEGKANGIGWTIVLGIIILVVLMTAGTFFIMANFFSPGEGEGKQVAGVEAKEDLTMGPTFEMGEFVVNLAGSRGMRYIKTDIVLEVDDQKLLDEVSSRKPQFRDAINEILRSQEVEDVEEPNLVALKEQIVVKLNELLPKYKIKRVYFNEFVIQ